MQPGANEVGIWVLVVFGVISAAANIAVIAGVFKTQRRQVQMQENIATVPQLEKVEGKMESGISAAREGERDFEPGERVGK
jgi:hypothetical protein